MDTFTEGCKFASCEERRKLNREPEGKGWLGRESAQRRRFQWKMRETLDAINNNGV